MTLLPLGVKVVAQVEISQQSLDLTARPALNALRR